MDNALAQIGLTKNEARIYRVLLELGKTQVGVLSRKTGVHRRSCYRRDGHFSLLTDRH